MTSRPIKVILSVTNDLSTDQRVNKVALTLVNSGFDVLIIGRLKKNNKEFLKRPYSVIRFNLFFQKGVLFYFEYNFRLLFFLLFNSFDILLSNDLDTLLPNFIASKVKRKKLIYDSHELFSELPEIINRKFVKSTWLLLEKILLPRINYSYTVSNSIANYYYLKYGINMGVVKNVPLYRGSDNYIKNPSDDKIIIYQGAVNKDRGIDLMIKSMQYVEAKLYIVGTGDVLDDMIQLSNKLRLKNKVTFKGHVEFKYLHKLTKQADLGLSFEEDSCLSYRFSLPNKIFDYLHADIPILISDLPEFKNILSKYNVGEVLRNRDAKHIASQINQLLNKPKQYWIEGINNAKKEYCWEKEESVLLSFFS